MFYTSEIMTTPPSTFRTPLEARVYRELERLGILFERIDSDPGITMEDCLNIDRALHAHTVKTIFLCNRQQTLFYLYVTRADKPFVTKDFGCALGIPRVSFAPGDKLMEIAGTDRGAATIFSLCLESAKEVTAVLDAEVLQEEHFCCTDGTATCFVKIRTEDLLGKFLPATGHSPKIIQWTCRLMP